MNTIKTIAALVLYAASAFATTPGLPSGKVLQENQSLMSSEGMVLHGYTGSGTGTQYNPTMEATDGTLQWEYTNGYLGTVLYGPTNDGTGDYMGEDSNQGRWVEFNTSNQMVNSVTLAQLNAQLSAHNQITAMNHDAARLPNGLTAVIASNYEVVATSLYGNVPYVGNVIVVFDKIGIVQWVWNGFDHQNDYWPVGCVLQNCYRGVGIKRSPTLKDKVVSGHWGEPPTPPGYTWAVDLFHANTLTLAADGNFVLSMRNQDWVIKINYGNGTGSGTVVWRLGQGGDFTMTNSLGLVWPWFSHQHDSYFLPDGTFGAFDNGNTRVAAPPIGSGPGNSRGQAYTVDELNMVADVLHNFDMGSYSGCFGSSQLLANGDYFFESGYIQGPGTSRLSQDLEFTPNGTLVYQFQGNGPQYRSFRQ